MRSWWKTAEGCATSSLSTPSTAGITGPLMISTMEGVDELIGRLGRKDSGMLTSTTGGVHMHTVEGATEQVLEIIEEKLRRGGDPALKDKSAGARREGGRLWTWFGFF